jgi:UPF0042 nucleotide-binding protein
MDTSVYKLTLVTGLSGAGKSVALATLEDNGYNCIDNLPLNLLPSLASEIQSANYQWQHTAVGIDARSHDESFEKVPLLLDVIRSDKLTVEIIYLEADNEILLKRFSETRRRHPLTDHDTDLESAINEERELLSPLTQIADLTINTSKTTLHQLRRLLSDRVTDRDSAEMSVLIKSFGFKHGMPANADFMFDMRCLPNPHWDPDLRPMTGRDKPVADFLEKDERVQEMYKQLESMIANWTPCFALEGRSYLTFAIGCTGGQHRSVYMVERLGKHFQAFLPNVQIFHRELS